MPGNARSIPDLSHPRAANATTICPVCKRELARFRCRRDVFGTPRRVDLIGTLCDECLDAMRRERAHVA